MGEREGKGRRRTGDVDGREALRSTSLSKAPVSEDGERGTVNGERKGGQREKAISRELA
jgi:hypothetical protein